MQSRARCHAAMGVALLVVVLSAAAAAAQAPAGVDPDLRFLDEMIVHHQGAIDEARAIQAKARKPEVRRLAADIIRAQQAEIDQMRAWRRAWFPDAPEAGVGASGGAQPGGMMGGMPHDGGMMQQRRGAGREGTGAPPAADPDLAFVETMIPHHRDAVAMSRAILGTTKRPEIQRLARGIIEAQEREIALMEGWQREWAPPAR